MILDKLSVINYKNLSQVELSFSPQINCFIGNNGMGKTNLLDAIYFLSFCKSATSTLDAQLIRHDTDFFLLQGAYTFDDGSSEKISAGGKVASRKIIKRGDKAYKKISEHIGLIPIVLISPYDNTLVTGFGDERRRFMDMVISQYDHPYLYALTRYNKTLQQRNALLKAEAEPDWSVVEIFEQMMAEDAQTITAARQQLIESMQSVFYDVYAQISGNAESVKIEYASQCMEGNLLEKLRAGRSKERIVGHTLYGPHRDDIEMSIEGYPVKREGSQGQNKTFVLALKFAQFEYLKQQGLKTPILLLDDVFDKLDTHRVENIMKLVSSEVFGQIFVTDTNRDHLDMILSHGDYNYRIFNITNGQASHAKE